MEGTTQTQKKKPSGETAEGFIRKVRQYTRRRYTAEQKIRVVLEGMKREITVSELCRQEGIASAIYYSWVKDFMEGGKASLQGDTLRGANRDEVMRLKKEKEQLKALIGEKELELYLYKKSLSA